MAVKKNDDKIGQEKNEIDNELGVSYVYPKIGHTRVSYYHQLQVQPCLLWMPIQ